MTRSKANTDIIQRVYETVKYQVIRCKFPPGDRIKIESVAEQLRVSPTPVREVFNHLVAEDLIVKVPKMGFFMKIMSEHDIRNLYEVSRILIEWSLRMASAEKRLVSPVTRSGASEVDGVERVNGARAEYAVENLAFLFLEITTLSSNDELSCRIRNINDRLHYFRIWEYGVFTAMQQEIDEMVALYRSGDHVSLRGAAVAYHSSRMGQVHEVLRAMRSSASVDVLPSPQRL